VSQAKGKRAAGWVAAYLRPWFPSAEKPGSSSLRGRDVLGTPGLAIEVKTGAEWRPNAWLKQAAGYASAGELAVLVYLPPGCGEAQVGEALAIVPLRELLPLAVAAGYAPPPEPREVR
jgi:hypothetical protein